MKTAIALCILLSVVSCTRLEYVTKEGTSVTYTRVFATSTDVEAEMGDAKVSMKNQKIDTTVIGNILDLATKVK